MVIITTIFNYVTDPNCVNKKVLDLDFRFTPFGYTLRNDVGFP